MSINNSDFLFQRRCFCIHMINCPVMLDFDFDSDFGITQFFCWNRNQTFDYSWNWNQDASLIYTLKIQGIYNMLI